MKKLSKKKLKKEIDRQVKNSTANFWDCVLRSLRNMEETLSKHKPKKIKKQGGEKRGRKAESGG